jgi:hypothetical protein
VKGELHAGDLLPRRSKQQLVQPLQRLVVTRPRRGQQLNPVAASQVAGHDRG